MDELTPAPEIADGTDAGELAPAPQPGPTSRDLLRKRIWTIVALAAFVVVLVVLVRGLQGATVFFYNADEAIEERAELDGRRFRLQGTVVDGTVEESGDLVLFAVRYNGATVDVAHTGDPPQLFAPGVPVVIEGAWVESAQPVGARFSDSDGTSVDGWHFASDTMLVKHDNEYEADNGERLRDADVGGQR